MPANNAEELVVGANGKVLTAPLGSPVPATATGTPSSAWKELGFMSEDGLTVTDAKTMEVVRVWQLFYVARRIITERDFMVSYVMKQWNAITVPLAFGGGDIIESPAASGNYKYTPPEPQDLDERMMMIEWYDGAKVYRIVMERGMVTENVETNVVRTGTSDLPITFAVNGSDNAAPWYMLSNDPAFATA